MEETNLKNRIELLENKKNELELYMFRFNQEENKNMINEINRLLQEIKDTKILKFALEIRHIKTLSNEEKNWEVKKYQRALNAL